MDKTAICEYLDRIIGEPVSRIGRAANMVWIGVGKNILTGNLRGIFSNNEKLQVFNVSSDDTEGYRESWRLFKPGSEELHLVVSGTEINFE